MFRTSRMRHGIKYHIKDASKSDYSGQQSDIHLQLLQFIDLVQNFFVDYNDCHCYRDDYEQDEK